MPGLTAPVGDCSAFIRLVRRGSTRTKSPPLEAPAVEQPERMRIATRRQHEYNPSVTARVAGAIRAQSSWRSLGRRRWLLGRRGSFALFPAPACLATATVHSP